MINKIRLEDCKNLTLIITVCIFLSMGTVADAGCRWIWKGGKTHWVCDKEKPKKIGRAKLCGFDERKNRKGRRVTVSQYCRPDGSLWKEIVVRPKAVVVKLYSSDGSLINRNKIKTAGYDHSSYQTPQTNKNNRSKVKQFVGVYQASIPGGRVSMEVFQKGKNIGIRARVRPFHGKNSTYHFNGHIKGRRVIATHTSGHKFNGVIKGRGIVEGLITMKDGRRVGLTLRKR